MGINKHSSKHNHSKIFVEIEVQLSLIIMHLDAPITRVQTQMTRSLVHTY